ncbi:unnamed protein product [Notodromas monacha]|uniref:PDZ domain-containing protein n=1 Tax=Notodromas monacha TaxID=399045 RepID=A0A7R9BD98_9CRUS|nr:unnamed protein product [Notodromas monacha]CAG0912389.1 unnamed protein product [Notodromas monacha]
MPRHNIINAGTTEWENNAHLADDASHQKFAVSKDDPASKESEDLLKEGDKILSVNGVPCRWHTLDQFQYLIFSSSGPIILEILRGPTSKTSDGVTNQMAML